MSFENWFHLTELGWWLNILDITLVVILMYFLYKLLKGTVAIRIFIGMISIYLLWKLLELLEMHYLGDILGQFIGVGVIALIVVFQQEIRKFLLLIASPKFYNRFKVTKWMFVKLQWQQRKAINLDVEHIVKACFNLAKTKTGALIVISNHSDMGYYTSSGDKIYAHISSRIIEAIFQKESPLHDGAMIIANNRILAAGCVLPVSDNTQLPNHFGLRHRAATGITEQSNAIAIIVSEETGDIAYFKSGRFLSNFSPESLSQKIESELY